MLLQCFLVVLVQMLVRSQSVRLDPTQYKVLRDIFDELDGQNWKIDDSRGVWDFGNHLVDPCQGWAGISCSVNTDPLVLEKMTLYEMRLQGTLPSSIGSLTSLTFLDFDSNSLWGTIPSTLGRLSKLKILYLFKNSFSGSLSNTFSGLSTLTELRIDHNHFSGDISILGELSALVILDTSQNYFTGKLELLFQNKMSLKEISLNENRISGSIPSSISLSSNLTTFSAGNNSISGIIPKEVGELTSLVSFHIEYNHVSGSISSSFGRLANLIDLCIYANSLTGELPSTLFSLSQLQQLYLDSNNLRGTLSPLVGQLMSLTHLSLGNNQLEGSVPSEIGRLALLSLLNLQHNALTGSIPVSVGGLAKLVSCTLSFNSLSGRVPSEFGLLLSLESLQVDHNQLSHTIPSTLVLLTNLTLLKLDTNKLSGSLPPGLEHLVLLQELWLHSNHFTSTLPPNLGLLSNLKVLMAQTNSFTGTIPRSIGDLSVLVHLDLSSNFLGASLPSEMQNMTNLVSLILSDNHLTNANAWSFLDPATQTSIKYLDIGLNRMTGTIPTQLFSLPDLELMGLYMNCLSGRITADVCNARKLETLLFDGLTSGRSCQHKFWPKQNLFGFDATWIDRVIDDSIPSCLFSLPRLQRLHLAGNGLVGPIPELNISSRLADLVLAHNMLTSSIPETIQNNLHNIKVCDFSYNKLSGQFNGRMNSSDTHLGLIENRLSGKLPESIRDAQNVSILAGNLFDCYGALPVNDPEFSRYHCGSQTIQTYLIVFFVLLALGVTTVSFTNREQLVKCAQSLYSDIFQRLPLSSLQQEREIVEFERLTFKLVLACLFLLPIYSGLTFAFGTHQYQYLWMTSAIFKSGLWVFVIYSFIWSSVILLTMEAIIAMRPNDKNVHSESRPTAFTPLAVCKLGFGVAFNIAVILAANIVYVVYSDAVNHSSQVALKIALALIKIGWNSVAVPLIWRLSFRTESEVFKVSVLAFNNIVAPIIALALSDGLCFVSMFFSAAAIESSYTIIVDSALGPQTLSVMISYDPPFLYSSQCSFTLVQKYCPIFVLMSVWTTFLKPLLLWLQARYLQKPTGYTSSGLVSEVLIIVTFGIICPVIGVCQSISVLRYLASHRIDKNADAMLVQRSSSLVYSSRYIVLVVAVLFHAIFVIDVIGDFVGARICSIFGIPFIIFNVVFIAVSERAKIFPFRSSA